jgi:predicted phage terminase large subunit-like protein
VPSGGALFKEKDFTLLDEEPRFLCTFLTIDSAETSKTYNDASVFSFWGLYKVADFGQEVDEYALHWIDCWELRVEPKELEENLLSFIGVAMLHSCKPRIAAIEKKSTGVTLCSILKDLRGIDVREVQRTRASGSKADRYLEMQPIIASKLISFTRNAKHFDMCVKHMIKITANNSHRHDDICDTVYDAVKIALIDKTLYMRDEKTQTQKTASKLNAQVFKHRLDAIRDARGY